MIDKPLKVKVTLEYEGTTESFSEYVPATFNTGKVFRSFRNTVNLESSLSAMQEIADDLAKWNTRAYKRLKRRG